MANLTKCAVDFKAQHRAPRGHLRHVPVPPTCPITDSEQKNETT